MLIRAYKSRKLLEVWSSNKVIKRFPIAIGKNEVGHKKHEGDLKTPEGEYEVFVKNPKSKFYLSLGLNYPSLSDFELAVSEQRLNFEEYKEIVQKAEVSNQPVWGTPLGGQIYIHGELEEKKWSEGCLRLYNQDMKWLFDNIEVGTKVVIYP